MKYIYLDHAAATPLDSRVLEVMQPYWTEKFYNPSATYLPAVKVRKDLEIARTNIAGLLGARPSEIVFTAGGTEANNLVIRGVMDQNPGANVIISAIEHDSVLEPAQLYDCKIAPVNAQGLVETEKLKSLIDEKTVLVSVMYANNEVGTVQPIRQIGQILEELRHERRKSGNELPLYFHTDAAQAAGYLDLHVARLGVDFLTLNAGKIYGPKQSGMVFAKSSAQFMPQILGGGQERGVRSGTENVAGSIGLSKALELAQNERETEVDRLKTLQQLFFELLEQQIPNVIINGSRKLRLPNNVHITIPQTDNERLIFQLDEAGVLCAAGSACSAGDGEPSHVLRAMGISDELAQSSLRFSMGRSTDESAVRSTVELLAKLV